jgi:hypothetical protein
MGYWLLVIGYSICREATVTLQELFDAQRSQ